MIEVTLPLLVFIPCHNRRAITLAFLEHLQASWPSRLSLSIHLLDDGSTDGTAAAVRTLWPGIVVHILDGRQFWGGALNAIQNLLMNPACLGLAIGDDPWVMVANDDIYFPPGSLDRAIDLFPHWDLLAPAIDGGWGRVEFDASTGRFLEFSECGSSNLATTMATFLRRSTWLQAEPVPRGIPHYLSDYWFTHSLSCQGFRMSTNSGFKVCCRADTTRPSGPQATGWRARWAYWRDCLDPRSPDYIPASITFRGRFSVEPYKFWILFFLQVKVLVLKLITGYRPSLHASLQA